MTEERREQAKSLGFLEVNDKFWIENELPIFCFEEFTWAYPLNNKRQKYMPFNEKTIEDFSLDELKLKAQKCID